MPAPLLSTSTLCKSARKQARSSCRALADRLEAEDIHRARRHVKRARAALRLLQPAVSTRTFRKTDDRLRRAAKPLGELRDAQVLLDTLTATLHKYRGAVRIAGTAALRQSLADQLARQRQVFAKGRRRHKSQRLLKAVAHMPHRPGSRRHTVESGVRHLYAHGRRALAHALHARDTAALHELRKQAKFLSLGLRLLARKGDLPYGALARSFHQLSDELGDDHDLSLLQEYLSDHPGMLAEVQGRTRFAALLQQERTALQKRALLRGEALYRRRPKSMLRHLRRMAGSARRAH